MLVLVLVLLLLLLLLLLMCEWHGYACRPRTGQEKVRRSHAGVSFKLS